MTTYIKEQDYLRDQIKSNNLAIKHFTQQLEEVFIQEDFIGTADKVFDGYEKIIELIKLDSKEMRKRIKECLHSEVCPEHATTGFGYKGDKQCENAETFEGMKANNISL